MIDRKKLRELAEKAAAGDQNIFLTGAHMVALLDKLDAKDARIEKLREALKEVVDKTDYSDVYSVAYNALAADDKAAKG